MQIRPANSKSMFRFSDPKYFCVNFYSSDSIAQIEKLIFAIFCKIASINPTLFARFFYLINHVEYILSTLLSQFSLVSLIYNQRLNIS